MKQLLLIRHAKSSWADVGASDFDRRLNDRGERDAPMMARRLKEAGVHPDLLLSSAAVRAYTTAALFADVLKIKKSAIAVDAELYLAAPIIFLKKIQALPDTHKTVAIFSHNPGITDFANSLCSVRVDDMPTCSIFAVQSDLKHWTDFAHAAKQFWFFDYPKKY